MPPTRVFRLEGCRERLGVVVVQMGPPLPRFGERTTPTFRVDCAELVEVGLDGEAVIMDPPLLFESRLSALRARVVASPVPRPGLTRARRLSPPLR